MPFKAFYSITVRDSRSRVISRRRYLSRSYVEQFSRLLFNTFSTQAETAVDTGGTTRDLKTGDTSQLRLKTHALVDDSTYGLVVGTGTTAVAIADRALGTQIAHGTGAGQLQHAAHQYTTTSVSGSTASFKLKRVFTNASGASITVQEAGIYAGQYDTGSTGRIFLIVRDIISGGLAVPNGGAITIEYTVEVTV